MATPAKSDEVHIEKLSEDIATLKSDIAALAGTLRDLGAQSRDSALDEGRRRLSAVKSDAHDQFDLLQRRAEDLGQQARDSVHERPVTALLIAGAIGMVFGLMTARK